MIEHDRLAPFRKMQPRVWWAWTQVLGTLALIGALLSWGIKEANKRAQANHAKAVAKHQPDLTQQNVSHIPPKENTFFQTTTVQQVVSNSATNAVTLRRNANTQAR